MSSQALSEISITTKQSNAVIDIFKYILSLSIICIHTGFLGNILYPWLRIAVPCFFMMASYFFFRKMGKVNSATEQNAILKDFIKRNLQLYTFWFIALAPITFSDDYWHQDKNIFMFFVRFFRKLIFGSTFGASWFISALIIGTVLITVFSRFFNNKALLVITFTIYCITCIRSSYSFIYNDISIINRLCGYYDSVFFEPWNSFPVALFWITCGKFFGEKTSPYNIKRILFVLVPSAVLLYTEWFLVKKKTSMINNNCYFFLVPLCISIFALILTIPSFSFKGSVWLRKASVIYFTTHFSIITLVQSYAEVSGRYFSSAFLALITFVAVTIISLLIISLENFKALRWLKYAH